MKFIYTISCLVAILATKCYSQNIKINLATEKKPLPILLKHVGAEATLFGYFRYVSNSSRDMIITISGPDRVDKLTRVQIVIKEKYRKMFHDVTKDQFYEMPGIVHGRIIIYRGNPAIEINDRKEFDFVKPKKLPVLR